MSPHSHGLLVLLSGELSGGILGGGLPWHACRKTFGKVDRSAIVTATATATGGVTTAVMLAAAVLAVAGWPWAVAGWRDWAKERRRG